MFYIKLDRDMSLTVTVSEPIFRGDNLCKKITYLLPLRVGDMDMLTATAYLSYIRADGTADVVALQRMEEKYNEEYYQYTFPIPCSLTRYAGEVCTWIQIYDGSPNDPVVAKSGECILHVQASQSMDEYIDDRSLGLIYQIQKNTEQALAEINATLTELKNGSNGQDGDISQEESETPSNPNAEGEQSG